MVDAAISCGKLLTRGELAVATSCNIETIRYYEKIGLLPPPLRSQGGHRLYGLEPLKRVNFIRRSRELGFTLEEIRDLLHLVDGHKYTCGQIEALAREHVSELNKKITDMKKLKGVLERLVSQCARSESPECPVIDALFDTRTPPIKRA